MSKGLIQSDTLSVQGLKVQTHIGVYPWEQQIFQTLLFDITFPIERINASLTFEQAIDYDALCQAVTAFVANQSFELIEVVAERVAELVLTQFQVKQVTIRVTKPRAIANAAGVSATIVRSK